MVTDGTIELLSRLFKLLNDPNRLRIIFAIGKGAKPVTEIMQETSLSQTLVSFHLRPLRESGILTTERKGAFIYYRITEPALIDLLASLGGVPIKQEDEEPERTMRCTPMRFMRQWMNGE
ncbi:MAG TPA: metalloregulator ArsR/SmtB family transcription factor [Syntrophorhabdaceae bacterium]|jgi:DNA-binding transcriptional ArsR family regulator